MEGAENFVKKDKDPKEWLKEHYSSDEEEIKAYKKRHYIKEDFDLDWNGIKEFDEYRSEKMKAKLKEILLTEQKMPVANRVLF